MQNQKLHYAELIKEIIILTVAVAIIAAAVFFFLVPSHTSVSSISGLGTPQGNNLAKRVELCYTDNAAIGGKALHNNGRRLATLPERG